MNPAIYPWLEDIWQALLRSLHDEKLPHALLMSGVAGLGKRVLAEEFAQLVLCKEHVSAQVACAICKPCDLFSVGNHPDLKRIALEEKSQHIKVAQIREYLSGTGFSSSQNGYQVMIMQDADKMNLAAANGLLKTLEEPTSKTLIILITDSPEKLLPTIKSRCQQIHCKIPIESEAVAWLKQQDIKDPAEYFLQQAQGVPLLALGLSKSDELAQRADIFLAFIHLLLNKTDPVTLASQWIKLDLQLIALWLMSWINDLIRLKSTQRVSSIQHPDKLSQYKQISQKFTIKSLFLILDELYQFKQSLDTSLNKQMLMESLLLRFIQRT